MGVVRLGSTSRSATANAGPALLHIIPDERPTPHNLSNLPKKNQTRRGTRNKNATLKIAYASRACTLKRALLPAAHDFAPIANRACARSQRAVRPEDGDERRRRLEALRDVDVLEHFARYGEVVLHRLLVP